MHATLHKPKVSIPPLWTVVTVHMLAFPLRQENKNPHVHALDRTVLLIMKEQQATSDRDWLEFPFPSHTKARMMVVMMLLASLM